MSHVRIRCKAPPQPKPHEGFPRFNVLPSWPDVEVLLVDDEGKEHPLTCVEKITWTIGPPGRHSEPPIAVLTCIGAEIDADAKALISRMSPRTPESKL